MLSFSQFLSQTGEDQIVTTAPCRADLAGGTLDIWPLYLFHPGAVSVNIALEIRTACRIIPHAGPEIVLRSHDTGREQRFAGLDDVLAGKSYAHSLAAYLVRFFRPEGGFMLETHSQSPAGAGISGSSALMIATGAALARLVRRHLELEQLRVIAQNVEAQLIRVPTGCQDYYPAMYGGVSVIHLEVDGVRREEVPLPPEEMNQRFVLFYTGAPRHSGINNWRVFQQHIDGDRRVLRNFSEISRVAQAMHRALAGERWDEVGELIGEEWKMRRTNAPGISTPLIDKLIGAARRNGALAAKVCGAGGGGCVIALVEKGARQRVENVIREHGGQPLNFQVASTGLRLHTAGRRQIAIV
ncbi:MAG TPA: GHMP kinase [Candidatus Binatia bacterium]|nr:GHMP kinase [Candidatus Binatia bacterium]